MTRSLFITGSTGFIGKHLLDKISSSGYDSIRCLTLDAKKISPELAESGHLKIIQADLLDVPSYRKAIAGCDTVIHLAAATGKADARRYEEINVRGTQALVEVCEQEKVANLLHTSTIAARYPDKRYYPYAQSKERSEAIVRSSRLHFTILRPTIVVGQGGNTWNGFLRLAKLPVTPLIGDGKVKIQPVFIDDLVDCILSILGQDRFKGEVLEIGGPQAVTFEEFYGTIQHTLTDHKPGFVRLPYQPVKIIFGALETLHLPLPISAGQLSVFGNDGTIVENDLHATQAPGMKTVAEMTALTLQKEAQFEAGQRLERECRIYTQYLVSEMPSEYIMNKYYEAHAKLNSLNQTPAAGLSRLLYKLSIKSPFLTRIADFYSAFFQKTSLLRKKLILLVAILENSPTTFTKFEVGNTHK
jgi:nucleoside-diphosphate-sugar epimerase